MLEGVNDLSIHERTTPNLFDLWIEAWRQKVAAGDVIPTASRPLYSVLSNSRLRQAFGIELPHWRTQVHLVFELERSS